MSEKDISSELRNNVNEFDIEEIFIAVFRKWITTKFGEKFNNYPFSVLIRDYGTKFVLESLGPEASQHLLKKSDGSMEFSLNRYNIRTVTIDLIKKGIAKFPNISKSHKFTEKFKKHLDFFIKKAGVPDIYEIKLSEESPYKVRITFETSFEKYLKNNFNNRYAIFYNKISSFINDYLGIRSGNPLYGDLHVDFSHEVYGADEWVKNILDKKIKKYIKNEIPEGKEIKSIRFKPSTESKSELMITMSTMNKFSKIGEEPYNRNDSLRTSVKKYLNDLGYVNIDVGVK